MTAGSGATDTGWLFALRLYRDLCDLGRREFTLQASHQGVVGVDPLLDTIDNLRESAVRGNRYPISLLIDGGFVTAQLSADSRTLTYRLADTEPVPDRRSFETRENEELARIHQENVRRIEREANERESAARRLNGPSMAEQIRDYVQQCVAEAVEGIKATVAAEVEAALSRHQAAVNHDNGHEPVEAM
jgi:hypothetical protein